MLNITGKIKLRDSLQPKLLWGELRVKEVYA